MHRSFTATLFVLCAMAFASPGFAAENMTPKDAWAKMQTGELVLVDVRRPAEWRSTGLAPGAIPLTMGGDAFYAELERIASANPGKTLALICAAGGRSTMAAIELEKRGLSDVVDVKAGMLGGMLSSGWLDEGLPVEAWKE
jgi:rhodanese-related sulfurtransferase